LATELHQLDLTPKNDKAELQAPWMALVSCDRIVTFALR
jgi:hypothetical protein